MSIVEKKRDKDTGQRSLFLQILTQDTGVYFCKSSRLCKATRPREGAGGLNHNVGLEDEDVPRVLVPASFHVRDVTETT